MIVELDVFDGEPWLAVTCHCSPRKNFVRWDGHTDPVDFECGNPSCGANVILDVPNAVRERYALGKFAWDIETSRKRREERLLRDFGRREGRPIRSFND